MAESGESRFKIPRFSPPSFVEMARQLEEMYPIETPLNAGGKLFYKALERWIRSLEADLEDDESLFIVHRQGATAIQVTDVAYPSAQTLVLIGVDTDGNEQHVFAHVSTVQIEISKMKRKPEQERSEIGFHSYLDDAEEEAEE